MTWTSCKQKLKNRLQKKEYEKMQLPNIQNADPTDSSADITQLERDNLVANIQSQIKPIEPSEVCLHCGEPTANGARWCGPDCRDDHQEEAKRLEW
jgi:hypothetical protein